MRLPVKVHQGKTKANESDDGEVETHESGVAQPVADEERGGHQYLTKVFQSLHKKL